MKDMEFFPHRINNSGPARCIDGRHDPKTQFGPQQLGGTIHPLVLHSLQENVALTPLRVTAAQEQLEEGGIRTGVHRAEHGMCGMAKHLDQILEYALDNKPGITHAVRKLSSSNRRALGQLPQPLPHLVAEAYDVIEKFDPKKIITKGEALVELLKHNGAEVETLQGKHSEKAVFLNTRPNLTFDTPRAAARGEQSFNLDLGPAVSAAQALGVEPRFAIGATAILYLATERVLRAGQQPLPIRVIK